MSDLASILQRARDTDERALAELETIAIERITRDSGARRGNVADTPTFAVQSISLNPYRARPEFDATIGWIARRLKDSGVRVFDVTLRRQSDQLVLTAQWNRSFPAGVRERTSAPAASVVAAGR